MNSKTRPSKQPTTSRNDVEELFTSERNCENEIETSSISPLKIGRQRKPIPLPIQNIATKYLSKNILAPSCEQRKWLEFEMLNNTINNLRKDNDRLKSENIGLYRENQELYSSLNEFKEKSNNLRESFKRLDQLHRITMQELQTMEEKVKYYERKLSFLLKDADLLHDMHQIYAAFKNQISADSGENLDGSMQFSGSFDKNKWMVDKTKAATLIKKGIAYDKNLNEIRNQLAETVQEYLKISIQTQENYKQTVTNCFSVIFKLLIFTNIEQNKQVSTPV